MTAVCRAALTFMKRGLRKRRECIRGAAVLSLDVFIAHLIRTVLNYGGCVRDFLV